MPKNLLPDELRSPSRALKGLLWAKTSSKGPWSESKKGTPAQRKGKKFERNFLESLETPAHYLRRDHLWFEFFDTQGYGWAQVDGFLLGPEIAIILECKLTYTENAWGQLSHLYRPLVEATFDRPVVGVQVCKNITSAAKDYPRVTSIEEIEMLRPTFALGLWFCPRVRKG